MQIMPLPRLPAAGVRGTSRASCSLGALGSRTSSSSPPGKRGFSRSLPSIRRDLSTSIGLTGQVTNEQCELPSRVGKESLGRGAMRRAEGDRETRATSAVPSVPSP